MYRHISQMNLQVGDLFSNQTMLSFQELRQKFDLNTFFKYLQIRIFINKAQHHSPLLPDLSPLEKNYLKPTLWG